jgi:hypothetical protein
MMAVVILEERMPEAAEAVELHKLGVAILETAVGMVVKVIQLLS